MTTSKCPIVGIGASAGGLEALKSLFETLPADGGAAYVVIQHLDPSQESLTAEILARSSSMPTVQVKDGMKVEPDHAYVIPPNAYLTLRDHTLQLDDPILINGLRMPIDTFFWSLAEQLEELAIAIVVSGTGSDGTLGLRAVKGSGGLTMAQSPETARYDGMPRSAIATHLVDVVCPVGAMAEHLAHYLRHPYIGVVTAQEQAPAPDAHSNQLRSILALLHTRTGHDFRRYKEATMDRRIERRMGLHLLPTMEEYLNYLRTQSDEASQLFKDLLIGVTEFFRDTDAWAALDRQVIQPLVERRQADEPIRIWVPGCATGEEAYSIAIVLLERLAAADKSCPVQVFATDVDEAALSVGRTGVYPENIAAQLSASRLKHFFAREDHSYRVNKRLRETVTFATQNMISDPPFSNLDLISCRNLLIYLKTDVQLKILALFHFALRDAGCLFLGHSETANQQQEALFEPLEKKWRIYRRLGITRAPGIEFPTGSRPARSLAQNKPPQALSSERIRLSELAQRHLLQEYSPAAVLVNRNYEVLNFSGPTARFLHQPSGAPTQDLLSLARPELRPQLRVALRQVVDTTQRVTVDDAHIMREKYRVRVKITLKPLTEPRLDDCLYLVTFEDDKELVTPPKTKKKVTSGSDRELIAQLEHELGTTREELQSHIEEQESANEELQAANEEVMSVNEEMQSTNEELETSKEELQSMNEELTTVNSQLKEKLDEFALINNDLTNLLSSTDIATLFLDADFHIGRFTPATQSLFNLISTDVGRPLSDIRQKFSNGDLLADARQVLQNLTPVEREVSIEGETFYLRRIMPYRTGDNRITGVVITFIDITQRKKAEEHAQRLASVVRDSNDAITLQNRKGKILAWNAGAVRMYGWSEQEALGMPIRKVVPEAKLKAHQRLLDRASADEWLDSFETQRVTKDGHQLDVSVTLTPLHDKNGRITTFASTERDITARIFIEKELRESEANFRAMVESGPDALIIADTANRVRLANSKAERLYGYSRDELQDIQVDLLSPERFRKDYAEARKQFLTDINLASTDMNLDIFALTKSGDEIPVELSISPLQTDQGTVTIMAVRDVTERKKTEAAIRSAMALAESASATKSRFLATASHDLRQPLQSLNLLNSSLLKTVDDPEARKLLTMQGDSLMGMSRLLNSLLDISKLEAGAVTTTVKDVAVQPILQQLRADFEAEALAKGLQLEIKAQDITVRSDADLLTQLVQNLLSNAVRYTQKGFVRLDCVRVNDEVRIAVTDSGVGIAEDQLDRIFDEFHQINRDPQQRYGGLGLGLSIVQRIAVLLETNVSVESEPGRGSTFAFTLPSGASKPAETTQKDAASGRATADSIALLIVDDEPAVLDATRIFLSLEPGFKIATATSVTEACAVLEEFAADVVVTDYHLGEGESGVDIVRVARRKSSKVVPAILVSGDTTIDLVQAKLEHSYLMRKPLESEKLLTLIQQALAATRVVESEQSD